MADISKEIQDFQSAAYGEQVRGSMISLAQKVNSEVEMNTKNVNTITASEATREANETKRETAEKARAQEFLTLKTNALDATNNANAAADKVNQAMDGKGYATTVYVNEQIANIHQFRREIVAALPQRDIKTNVIYMMKSNKPNTHNLYDEYINVDGTPGGYELIGSTAPDLTGYAKESFVNNAFTSHNSDSSCHNDIRNDLAGKSNKSDIVNNLYSSRLDLPLSANMGRELKSSIDAIKVPAYTSELINDSNYETGAGVASSIGNHSADVASHQDIRKSISRIGGMVSIGTNPSPWIVGGSYTSIGNKLIPVNNDLFQTASGVGKVTIKKKGIYLLVFNGIYDNTSTPNDRIWLQIKQNGRVLEEIPCYIWYTGSISYSKVIAVNDNDYVEADVSSTSASLQSKGKDILQIVCLGLT